MGGGAHHVRISAYTGQFYRRAIFVLFCIFLRSTPLPHRRGAPYVNIPQIPVQRCGILLNFVLYWVQNQHSRAAPGAVCQKTSTLPYRECRGEHCSPANLAQQRSFGKAFHKANGHGRAMLAPTMHFFDSLCRAAPGAKEATHEQHHRGKTRSHPQQRQPDAAGGHRRTFAGFMDLLACPQAERLLHRHSGMHVGTDIFDYAAYIWAAYQLRV